MVTKLIKRNNSKDVFDKIVEQDDDLAENLAAATDAEETEAAPATDPVESAGSTLAVEPVRRSRWLRRLRRPPAADAEVADAVDEDTDDEAKASAPAPAAGKRWRRGVVVGAGVLIFVATLAVSGLLGWQLKQQKDIQNAGRAALAAAQNYAVVLTSIDSSNVDKNFNQVVDGSTGEFKDMYTQSASQLRQVLIDNKAMSKGTVIDSAIKSVSKTKVELLLFVDQWVSNVVTPQPRMDRSRVAVTMELIDGRWLASKVDLK